MEVNPTGLAIIGTKQRILIENRGQAWRNQRLLESLGTESVGTLSIMCFICRVYRYYNIKLETFRYTHFCNNSMTVKRLKDIQIRIINKTTQMIRADQNVQVQIEAEINKVTEQQQQSIWETKHIKSYQKV